MADGLVLHDLSLGMSGHDMGIVWHISLIEQAGRLVWSHLVNQGTACSRVSTAGYVLCPCGLVEIKKLKKNSF